MLPFIDGRGSSTVPVSCDLGLQSRKDGGLAQYKSRVRSFNVFYRKQCSFCAFLFFFYLKWTQHQNLHIPGLNVCMLSTVQAWRFLGFIISYRDHSTLPDYAFLCFSPQKDGAMFVQVSSYFLDLDSGSEMTHHVNPGAFVLFSRVHKYLIQISPCCSLSRFSKKLQCTV